MTGKTFFLKQISNSHSVSLLEGRYAGCCCSEFYILYKNLRAGRSSIGLFSISVGGTYEMLAADLDWSISPSDSMKWAANLEWVTISF